MKNLKKIAALVIVLALALSTVSFAAYTDVKEDASYSEAVTVMSALGLLKGYEDGTFGPDKTITRAEFAAVVVRMLGMEAAAAGAATATNFADVPATHWAAGYVKIANQKEIIAGYGDGNFGPDAEVTYEQAIKMLVCALGYAPMFADVKDAYPTSYMAQANTLGMTVGAPGKIGDKATRATVARLVYNALDDKIMEQISFGSEKEYGIPTLYSTPLAQYLKIAKVDATVAPVSFNAEDAAKVTLSNVEYNGAGAGMYGGEYRDVTISDGEYDAVEGLVIPKGYAVTAYVDYNEDDMVVLAVVPKAGKNEVLTLTATQMEDGVIEWGTAGTNATNGTLEYYKTSSAETSRTEQVKIDGNIVIYVNQNTEAETDTDEVDGANQYALGEIPTMTLINNDSDAAYDVMIVSQYVSGVVEEIFDADFGVETTAGQFYFDEEDEEVTFALTDVNGKEIKFADIKVGDILNVFESKDASNNTFYDYIVSSDKVEGTVTEIDGNGKVYIGGKEYKDPATVVAAGDKGIFYVDICGVILDKELDVSSRTFGIYYNAYDDVNGADTEAKVTVFTKDGKFENFTFAKNVDVNGTNKVKATDLDTAAKVQALVGSNPGVVMYSANSAGAINAIYTADQIDTATDDDYYYETNYASSTWTEVEYDADDSSIGGVTVADNAVIVTFEDDVLANGTGAKDKYALGSKAVFAHEEMYKVAYVATEDDEAEFVIVYGAKAKADPASPVMVVSAAPSSGETADGDPYYIVKGYVNGELKSINVDADTNIYAAEDESALTIADINKGAMVQFTEGDMVAGLRVIATADEIKAIINGTDAEWGVDAKDEDTGFFKSGAVEKYASSMIYFADATKVNFKAGTKIVKFTVTTAVNDNDTPADESDDFEELVVNRVFAGYTMANAETNEKANTNNANDDIVITYNFDKESLGGIFVDVKGDARK
ncbi:MAG: S-layer homology domain-containing protein [Ruminococcaceae bacterium]|nr:S-layer homology domain-containing protein [Oscillospiraceae bacterium]